MTVILRILVSAAVVTTLACSSTPSEPSSPSTTNTTTEPVQCSIATWACTSTYGAIAYASGGSWGLAYNYPSQSAANNSAIANCPKSGCSVVAQFQNSCGALATARTGQAGWATAQSGDLAETLALAQCYGH